MSSLWDYAWKFLALATGIDSTSSTYACIWCKCPALERHSSTCKWSISDPQHRAWTTEENIRIVQSRKKPPPQKSASEGELSIFGGNEVKVVVHNFKVEVAFLLYYILQGIKKGEDISSFLLPGFTGYTYGITPLYPS